METPREPSETDRWAHWALVAVTLAAAWLRLPGLTAEEPWFDEVFSIVLASQDLPELWRRAVADETNPPGFYLLLWGWTRLGGFDLAWMRLLPLLAATGAVPAVALAARATGLGWTGALVAAALATVSPLMLAMSSELRAYAPLAFFTALTFAAAAQRRTLPTAIGGVVLVMLHYFGAFVVAALAIATLWTDRARWRDALMRALLGALPAALALGAWILLVIRAAGSGAVGGNASWIEAPGLLSLLGFGSQVVGTFGTFAGALLVAAVLLTAVGIAFASVSPRADGSTNARYSLALALLPMIAVALLSVVSHRELWLARYLIITLPGWWVLLGLAIERTRGRWREGAIAALLGWATFSGLHAEQTRTRKTAWSVVARTITAGGARTVCSAESFVALPLRYQALREELPLVVLDLADCTAQRAPSAMILRPGTEAALSRVTGRGARTGVSRDLGTTLPRTMLIPLDWTAR